MLTDIQRRAFEEIVREFGEMAGSKFLFDALRAMVLEHPELTAAYDEFLRYAVGVVCAEDE